MTRKAIPEAQLDIFYNTTHLKGEELKDNAKLFTTSLKAIHQGILLPLKCRIIPECKTLQLPAYGELLILSQLQG